MSDTPSGPMGSVCTGSTILGSDDFQRPQDHRVALRFHFIALLHAEGLIEDFRLQAVGDELALRQPLGEAGPDLAVGEEDAELIEHFPGCLLYTSPSPRDGL